jgi:NIMA (never in mitosis gene a)-related kinase
VLEYADGGDLSQVIKAKRARGETFSEKQIMWWFVQLCLAMAYLHTDVRVLHRDLKTQNIFLTAGRQVVKLGDFGIAKVLADTGTMKSMAKSVIGTPFYMSPELCEGKPYNHKSDVWALGCVLYEMATLRHAFDSNSLGALVLKILRGNYPPIDADMYSANLRGLVDWMLKADPADRPSVQQIVQTSWVNRLIKWFRNESGASGNPRADAALVSQTIKRGASGQLIAEAAAAAAAAAGFSEPPLQPPSPAVQQPGTAGSGAHTSQPRVNTGAAASGEAPGPSP